MKTIIAIAFAIVVILGGVVAYSVLRTPEAASGPIEAIPLEVTAETDTSAVVEAVPTEELSETVVEATAETDTTEPVTTTEPVATTAETGELTVYSISQDASQVSFVLDEELNGSPKTVVGTTNQVAGELALNFDDLSQTQIGTIQINARTLETDSGNRNRAIQNQILDTSSYEFITFTPTAVNGLPDAVSVGDTITFTIAGDLTIRDTTTLVTFTIEATAASDSQITGTASTIITRDAYGLTIPSVPSVANVEQDVELYIEFAANAG